MPTPSQTPSNAVPAGVPIPIPPLLVETDVNLKPYNTEIVNII
jgi:hypothetical protein